MEGRGLVASFDPTSGELTVHAATQGVHMVRTTLARSLGLEPEQVRVLAGDIGGSFGLKFGASREEVAVAALSKQLGRPVKWTEDRSENLTISGQAREESFDVEVAITEAVHRAEQDGVRGQDLTKYLMAAIDTATGGRTAEANLAVLLSTAETGGRLAAAYAAR